MAGLHSGTLGRTCGTLGTFVLAFLVTAATAHGQVVGAELSGTVIDTTRASLPGVDVEIRDEARGIVRSAVTDERGFYLVPNLVPGSYVVTARLSGFRTYARSGLTLTVGQKQVLNITLEVGDLTENVVVTGAAPTVDLASSTVRALVDSRTAAELPLNGRDWTSLAILQPAVATIPTQAPGTGASKANRGFGNQLTIAGTRPQLNDYRVDGVSVVDGQGGSPGSVHGGALGVDAIAEFSVLTSNPSAEYGRSAGGVVNAITKSGANQVHGSSFWFLRDEALDARRFTDPIEGPPPFHRDQFGASFGGPIQRNKMFFFAAYEGLRAREETTTRSPVPSPLAKQGILRNPDGTQTVVPIHPNILPYLALWPDPNAGLLADGNSGFFQNTVPTDASENYVTAKVDRTFSNADSMFVSWLWDEGYIEFNDNLNITRSRNQTRRDFLAVEETHVFGPALVNSMRFGINRYDPYSGIGVGAFNPLAADTSLGAYVGQQKYAPGVALPGITSYTGLFGSTIFHHKWTSFQFYNDAFWTKGAHAFKFGFAFERMQMDSSIRLIPNGTYSFRSFADYLRNQPFRFRGPSPLTTDVVKKLRQSRFGGYIQDDWRVSPRLTINLGLRYEMLTDLTEAKNELTNVRLGASDFTLGGPLFDNPTLLNFAPRLGFAWDPFGDGRTAIRGAFGVYDILPLPLYFFLGQARSAPYVLNSEGSNPGPGSYPRGAPPQVVAGGDAALTFAYVEPDPPRSYMLIQNLNLQREIAGNTVTIGYVGSRGVGLLNRMDDVNSVIPSFTPQGTLYPLPGRGSVPFPGFGTGLGVFWTGESSFHALTTGVQRRLSGGIQMGGSYTFQKATDTGTGASIGDNFQNAVINIPGGFFSADVRRGPADFNQTHVLAVNFIWQIPDFQNLGTFASRLLGGWQVAGVFSAASGVPFTPSIAGDSLGMGGGDTINFPSLVDSQGCRNPTNPGNPNNYLKLDCFTLASSPELSAQGLCVPFAQAPGTCRNLVGNVGRNSVDGPGRATLDISLSKNNPLPFISESFNAQFRIEVFNALNRVNLGSPAEDIFNANGARVANAGIITSQRGTARQIQLALKLTW